MRPRITLITPIRALILLATWLLVESCSEKKEVTLKAEYTADVVTVDGKPMLYYELLIANEGEDSISLTQLEVLDTSDSKFFEVFEVEDLSSRIASVDRSVKIRNNLLSPHQTAILYLELVLPADKSEFSLINNLHFNKGVETKTASVVLPTVSKTSVIVGAPLRGGPWTAIYGPGWELGHRRVIYHYDSVDRIPGRFAIDFVKMNNAGEIVAGNEDSIKNWLGYDADVLAVADGIVASVQNDFEESPTMSAHKNYEAQKATGNFISIHIGPNQYVFYEHLKPGSIRPRPGDQVRKGDVIASLGYTGNTTGPHLHFHIANKDSALGAEGIAYEFENYTTIGSYATLEHFGKIRWEPAQPTEPRYKAARPAPNSVLMFKKII